MLTVKISQNDFKDPHQWDMIAESLELPPGRREAIVTRIPGLLPVQAAMKIDIQIKESDEWMIGESIDGERQWVIHAQTPKFIAEIVDDSEDEFNPPFEYQTRSGQWLCNFLWLDYPPEDLTVLCREAAEAIEMYDDAVGLD